nr:PREDICTED: cathepsin B-like [Bemisia tabaci]
MNNFGIILVTCFVALNIESNHCQDYQGSYFVSDEFIRQLNDEQTDWKAGRNFGPWVTSAAIDSLFGGNNHLSRSMGLFNLIFDIPSQIYTELKQSFLTSMPDEFDGRKEWAVVCRARVSEVVDTGLCSASWALSVAQAIHDRYCIYYLRDDRTFSAKQLLDCCPNCGNWGCKGGNQGQAYEYLLKYGLPTGSNIPGENIGCKPWSLDSMRCLTSRMAPPGLGTGQCDYSDTDTCRQDKCTNEVFVDRDRQATNELFKIEAFWKNCPKMAFFFESDDNIMREIYTYGSITAQVTVFSDFLNYKRGVYHPTSKAVLLGDLVLRIVGWGTEGGVNYWLAAGVWGPRWGDAGFVKLRRRDKKLNMEDRMYVGRIGGLKCYGKV